MKAAVLAILLFLAAPVRAAIVPMEIVAPCTNDDGAIEDSTGACVGCTPLTDLKQIVVYWKRCGAPDSVLLDVISAVGRECDSIRFDLRVDSIGTTYDLWAFAEDSSGNRSRHGRHYSLAVPWSDYQPGLWGIYYADTSFASPVNGREDANIDFGWGASPPISGITSGRWAARWEGRIRALGTGTYAFRAYINNGFRMWVGGESVMCCDSWANPNTHWSSGSIALQAGTDYPFVAEYRNEFYEAFIHLYWTPPGGTEQIVPASAFEH